MLTLTDIAEDPLRLTCRPTVHDGSAVVVRHLTHADAGHLARFPQALSRASRRFSTFDGYDLATARELCDAIARHDKLRLVIEEVPSGRIVGLIEFSLDLTPADIARYRGAGILLSAATDCRFGPTPADDHQDRGLGTLVLPWVMETTGCSPGRGSSCGAASAPTTRAPSVTTRKTASSGSAVSPRRTARCRQT